MIPPQPPVVVTDRDRAWVLGQYRGRLRLGEPRIVAMMSVRDGLGTTIARDLTTGWDVCDHMLGKFRAADLYCQDLTASASMFIYRPVSRDVAAGHTRDSYPRAARLARRAHKARGREL